MSLVLKGLDRSIDSLNGVTKKVQDESVRDAVGASIVSEMQARVRVEDGTLRDSLVHEVSDEGVRIGSTDEGWYWHFVEFGTDRHPIRPRKKQVLADDEIFGVRVMHPGARPYPFVRPVIDNREYQGILIRKLKAAV